MNNLIIKLIVLILLGAKIASAGPVELPAIKSRIYCFYIPKGTEVFLDPIAQQKQATHEKLLDSGKDYLVKAQARKGEFVLEEEIYNKAVKDCESAVRNKAAALGQGKIILDIKGSDASYFESLTYFYPLVVESYEKKEDDKEILAFSDKDFEKLMMDLSQEDKIGVIESIEAKQQTLESIADNLSQTKLGQIFAHAQEFAGNKNVQRAATLATYVALWLFGAYLAPAYLGATVGYLFDIFYPLLGNSSGAVSYVLVEYPLRMKVINFSMNHTAEIITAGSLLLHLSIAGIKGLVAGISSAASSELVRNLFNPSYFKARIGDFLSAYKKPAEATK